MRPRSTPVRPLLAALLALATLLGGCATLAPTQQVRADVAGASVFDPDWAAKALPLNHDHKDPAEHRGLSTPNFQKLGYAPLLPRPGTGMFMCGDAASAQDGRRLAVTPALSGGNGPRSVFVLVDVTDPAAPYPVGEFVMRNASAYDAVLTPDAKRVLLGLDSTRAPEVETTLRLAGAPRAELSFRDCAGRERALPLKVDPYVVPGLLMVNVEDVTRPFVEDYVPSLVDAPHGVAVGRLRDETWVGLGTAGLAPTQTYSFYVIDETPVGARLTFRSAWTAAAVFSDFFVLGGHTDISFAVHPVTGQRLAYVANYHSGFSILDLDRDARPIHWTPVGAFNVTHGALPVPGLWEGRHYVLVGEEVLDPPRGSPTGRVHLYDDTDPAKPRLVANWTLPVPMPRIWPSPFLFSTHYMALVDRTLFVSLYHGGLWAVDLSGANLTRMPAIGVFVPDDAPARPHPDRLVAGAPWVMDVKAFPDGDLAVFDGWSGVYVVRFDATDPAPGALPLRG